MTAAFDVFGFGNALIDILVQVDDAHIEEFGLTKGNVHVVGIPNAAVSH
jgi:sugar/nucleoside kinase (ribokinase family)